eukprot:TRINITY_DN26744_c0_g1_i2.p1 TRINITY_DN26744_c0_g1~~TRINITY_DN26744_c0_g1_i2.p1  ORF type:complete len:593 (+),score=87.68 TRINITY_DN26744_c0_g1_i2:39-1781(+)
MAAVETFASTEAHEDMAGEVKPSVQCVAAGLPETGSSAKTALAADAVLMGAPLPSAAAAAAATAKPTMLGVSEPPTCTTATPQDNSVIAWSDVDPDAGWLELRSTQRARAEYVIMCLCNIAWTIDSSILPTFFHHFQITFGVSQTALNGLASAKGVTAALCGFPCGFLQEMLPRPLLIGIGMVFWAAGLLMCAVAPSFELIFAGRLLNGVGLGVVQPLLMSLIADKTQPTKRGSAFGSIYFVGAMCNTLFTLYATKYTATSILGFEGWRISLLVVSVFSGILGLLVLFCVEEPNAKRLADNKGKQTFISVFVKNMPKVVQLFKYPTFVLILLQGAPGSAPWTVFPNFIQWLQLNCFTDAQTGIIFSAFGWGTATSNLISGLLLNFVARRFPNHGPPTLANFSVGIGIPFLTLFFFILPAPREFGAGADLVPTYFASFLAFGMGAAMCATINKKVFSDIVPPSIYTYVFAIDQVVEQSIGNLFPLLLGILTDKIFDYDVSAVEVGGCAPAEAHKLGMGMFIVCNVAWAICFVVYLGMHCTYPKDRRRQLERLGAECHSTSMEKSVDAEGETTPLHNEDVAV